MKKINVLFSSRVEFKTITDTLKKSLINSDKINLIVVEKELNDLSSAIKEIDFDIFLHKNEHCQLNTCNNIKKIIDFCYEKNKVPAYVDFGYFGHYENFIIDFYLQNYESSIKKIFPSLSCDIVELQPSINDYFLKFKNKLASIEHCDQWNDLNLSKLNFSVIWAQYNTQLIKPNFKVKNNCDWIINLCHEIKNKNLVPVVKISPCDINYDINTIKQECIILASNQNQSKKFNIPFIKDVNFYLNKHAYSHIINCSSMSNELLLNNSKITAMGKSWFNDLEIFHEPKNWKDTMEYKQTPTLNINKWINWWNIRQFPKNQLSDNIEKIFFEFKGNH